jgi:hypothetical protein
VRIIDDSGDCSPMRSSRRQLALGLLAHVLGHAGLGDLRAVLLDDGASSSPSSLRIESICLRRKYSRCCFWAPDSTSSRMRLRTCSSASRSRCNCSASSSRSTTSSVSSSSTFCSKERSGA